MKDAQYLPKNNLSPNHLIIFLIVLCGCGIFSLVKLHSIRLTISQKQWQESKPYAYYMQVTEKRPDGGFWHWEVYVKGSQTISSTLLERGRFKETGSFLDPKTLDIEQIFNIANKSCASRAIIDCRLGFDSQFHYPNLIDSYEFFTIEVKQFIPCGQTVADCPVEPEISP